MAGERSEHPPPDPAGGATPTWDTLAEQLPPEASALLGKVLADRDGNGTPDILEGRADSVTHVSTEIHVDGRTYTSIDAVPEPERSRIRAALAGADQQADPDVAGAPPAPTRATTAAGAAVHQPIVTSAGWSPRSKLIATFVAIDVIVLAVVAVIVLR